MGLQRPDAFHPDQFLMAWLAWKPSEGQWSLCQFPHASRNAFASKLLTTQQMSRLLALLSPMSYERLSWSRRGQPQSYSSHGVAALDRRLIDERAVCSRRCMTAVALTELDFVVNPSKLQPGLYRLSPGCFICIQNLRTRFSEDKTGCLCGRSSVWPARSIDCFQCLADSHPAVCSQVPESRPNM